MAYRGDEYEYYEEPVEEGFDPFKGSDPWSADATDDEYEYYEEPVEKGYDPFSGKNPWQDDPQISDIDEPDDEGHSLWDIPRLMGRGAGGVAKTASMISAILDPVEWANRTMGVIGDFTQNEALQAYRDFSAKYGKSAKLRQYGEVAEDYYDEKLTPAMKASMKKTILASAEEEGILGEGLFDPWKIGGMIAESIPSTLISMGSGALITKGLINTGMKSAPKVVQKVLQRMIDKYGVNVVAGVVGGAAGEGTYSGLENANQAFEEMMDVPTEELAKSAVYRDIYNSLPAKFTPEQKHAYSKKILAMAAGGFVGSTTAVTTAVLGAPSGAFLGKLIGGEAGKSLWGNILKGAITEGFFEEAPQSGMERLVTNISQKFLVDPNKDVGEGVMEAMAAGAVTGFAMGGGMATIAGREGAKAPADPTAKDILTGGEDVTAKDILTGSEQDRIVDRTKGKRFKGGESIEAEEEAGEFTEEELAAVQPPPIPTPTPTPTPEEAASDRTGRKEAVPSQEPQGQEPVTPPELPQGETAPASGGVLQTPQTDADKQRQLKNQYQRFLKKSPEDLEGLRVQYENRVKDAEKKLKPYIDGTYKDLDETGLAVRKDFEEKLVNQKLSLALIKKAIKEKQKQSDFVERREAPDRPAWDAPFRAIFTEAQQQPEEKWTETARARVEAGDPAILDLARRMGQTIEPDTDLADALKTVHGRIQAGMQPRKRVQEMSDEELKEALHTDFLTGLRSKHAFEVEDTRKKHVASIDLDSLKYFNDTFGHQAGDEMLINFGNALKGIGADAYHISGDEYIVQHDDEAELKRILDEDVVANLKKFPIRVTLPNGRKIEVEVQFSYGTGQTISESEEALHAHKAWREATGKRAGRGEVPRQVYERVAEGHRPGDQREEVQKGLVGGPRKAPIRTTPPSRVSPETQIAAAAKDVDTAPTDAQKEAGNYKKGHLKLMGFDITLENPKGSTREGTDRTGKKWSQKMRHHYGYFKRSLGKDGDQIDVFIGDDLDSVRFFVVDQVDPQTGKFDEHKTLIGFKNEQEARRGYLANYEKGWQGLGAITEMTRDEFKNWLAKGKQTKPVGALEPSPKTERPEAPEPSEYKNDLKISIEKDIIPDWSGPKWKERFEKWAKGIDRPVTKLDEQIFKLRDFVEQGYGDDKNPIIVEFEHAYAYGPIDEILVYRYRGMSGSDRGAKSGWGDTVMLHDMAAFDIPKDSAAPGIKQIEYWLKDTSEIRQKQLTRNELKGIIKHAKLPVGPFSSIRSTFTQKWLQQQLDEGGQWAETIQHLMRVTGLDLGGVHRAFKNGDVALIERLAQEGKLAPKSYVGGYTKWQGDRKPSPEKESPAVPEQPEPIKAKKGFEIKIITPGNRRGYTGYFALVEADDLIPSHSPTTFQPDPRYIEGIQERTYHSDKREQQKVISNAQQLEPKLLLSDDPTPVNGPPLVTDSGIVLGGNSRTMSLQRAYTGNQGAKYKNALSVRAKGYGLKPKDVDALKKPVLVRVVYLPKDDIKTLHRMASDFNKSLTQGMSDEAQIASMGRNISMGTVEKIGLRMANRDLTLRELLGKKDGLEILQWLVEDDVIASTDKNTFVSRKANLLNDTGKTLIEKALFGSIIDDPDLLSAAPRSIINKIDKSLTSLARIKARGDKWDITPQLKDAVELATAAKSEDLSIREYLAQGSLFGDKKAYDDIAVTLGNLILSEKPTKLADRFKRFAADAAADIKDQKFLFEPKSFKEAFADAFDAQVKEPAPAPAKTIWELVLMSPDEFLTYKQKHSAETGEDSGINYTEQVEIEETGETIEREIDAVAYLNDIDEELNAYDALLNCLGGRSK